MMTLEQSNCNHDNVSFMGQFSMIGGYVCDTCKITIDSVVYHIITNQPHVLFETDKTEELKKYIDQLDEIQKEILGKFISKKYQNG